MNNNEIKNKKRKENNEKKKLHLLGWDWSEKTLLERNLQERKIRRDMKMGFAKDKERYSLFIYIYIYIYRVRYQICTISCQYILGMEMIFGGTQMEIIANNKQNQTFLCA